MTELQKKAYLAGYSIQKQAFIGTLTDNVAKGLGAVMDKGGPVLLTAPLLAGAGLGYGASLLTSPSDQTIDLAQKKLTAAEEKEFLAVLTARAAIERKKAKQAKEGKRPRSLHV